MPHGAWPSIGLGTQQMGSGFACWAAYDVGRSSSGRSGSVPGTGVGILPDGAPWLPAALGLPSSVPGPRQVGAQSVPAGVLRDCGRSSSSSSSGGSAGLGMWGTYLQGWLGRIPAKQHRVHRWQPTRLLPASACWHLWCYSTVLYRLTLARCQHVLTLA